MIHNIMVFVEKNSREVKLVVEKELINTKLDLICENLKDWDWYTVDDVDEIDKLIDGDKDD